MPRRRWAGGDKDNDKDCEAKTAAAVAAAEAVADVVGVGVGGAGARMEVCVDDDSSIFDDEGAWPQIVSTFQQTGRNPPL
ncbi:hypothetical protein C0J52_13453 [Blattella germanica]|nr:hypothetical protein C0J52_13453 [Blattella germanica]